MDTTENNTLNQLLGHWQTSNSDENFYAVLTELTKGTSSLHVPSRINKGQLGIASIYEDRGSSLLLVYSSAEAVSELSDKHLILLEMPTQDVLEFCEENKIPKIVINPRLANEFILQKPGGNVHELQEDTAVQIGRIRYELPHSFLTKLITNFREVKEIEQVYIYSQKVNEEISTALGVVLADDTQQSMELANLAFKNALMGEKMEHPNLMIIIQTADLLESVQEIQGALFYQK